MKTILITGASTGIGADAAISLAKDNNIIVHYNNSEDAAKEVTKKIEAKGGMATIVQADLMSDDGCRKLGSYVTENFDKLDVLINNAGGLIDRQPATEIEWGLTEKIFALNVFSTMKMTSLMIPLLKKGQDPSIINITSIAMRFGLPGATAYGAAKSAIDSFTRGVAGELAPEIRVNAIAPGIIITPFHDKYSSPEMLEQRKNACPLRKHGEPKHITMAIKMLIENDFMTGETIDINGGLSMR